MLFSHYLLLFTAENCSIYVRNLPFDITATELEGEFKIFGEIKQGGVQVRHNKVGQ